jgi:hypothetical protein
MKTIQNRQKKHQNAISSTPPQTSHKHQPDTPEATSNTAEKFQFLTTAATSNNEGNFLINAIESTTEKPLTSPNKNESKQQANPKMQRSTSSSILEKQ